MSKHKQKSKQKQKQQKRAATSHLSKGVLEVTRSGMGYVILAGEGGDVMVKPNDFGNALDGDTVRVKVIKENPNSGKKEGKITEVVSRKQTEFVGHIQRSQHHAFFVPDSTKPMPHLYIPLKDLAGAEDGSRVVVQLVQWEKEDRKPVGKVVGLLSPENENDAAMKELLAQAGFPLSFPEEVEEAAARLPEVLDPQEISRRRDMRSVLTITIDPADAKDFDDALSFQQTGEDEFEVGVHIADVSHYVEPGTPLNEEAYKRATSVYLPDRVNPMLPEKISNELCSLRPHEDKFTFSAVFKMNAKGDVLSHWLGRTVIHSDHRYAYEEVQVILDAGEGLHADVLLALHKMAQKIRKKRFQAGAINFSSQEVRFQLDENAKPIGVVVKESKESHQLIEEFMLLANRTVAKDLSKIQVQGKPLPLPYRVHDRPDPEKLEPFMVFARKHGHHFDVSDPRAIAKSFNDMLANVKGKPEQHVLEQLGIRTMAKAVYTAENIGHYGLAFEHYCHFTSPIRRYPDVMVHRTLATVLAGHPVANKKTEEQSKHCSERERAAMECERAGNKYKQVEFLKAHIGETFAGVISGVAAFGFWVETVDHKCEGLVSMVSLSDFDDFRHVEGDYSLVGRRSGRKFRMGDKVTIKVVAANLEKRQLDFEWVLQP
ncbi:MAG: ribonuclease R [Sphingobacteriia bacterium]|nr:MAG: ribonuclease R [Sphingobacteriia bacterium]